MSKYDPEYNRRYKQEHKEQVLAHQKRYREKRRQNPELVLKDREYQREYRKNNPKKIKNLQLYHKDRRAQFRREFDKNYKEGRACLDCWIVWPVSILHYDHRPGTKKLYNISHMVCKCMPILLIEAEIAKCDLVCANCHGLRTEKRRRNKDASKT